MDDVAQQRHHLSRRASKLSPHTHTTPLHTSPCASSTCARGPQLSRLFLACSRHCGSALNQFSITPPPTAKHLKETLPHPPGCPSQQWPSTRPPAQPTCTVRILLHTTSTRNCPSRPPPPPSMSPTRLPGLSAPRLPERMCLTVTASSHLRVCYTHSPVLLAILLTPLPRCRCLAKVRQTTGSAQLSNRGHLH